MLEFISFKYYIEILQVKEGHQNLPIQLDYFKDIYFQLVKLKIFATTNKMINDNSCKHIMTNNFRNTKSHLLPSNR